MVEAFGWVLVEKLVDGRQRVAELVAASRAAEADADGLVVCPAIDGESRFPENFFLGSHGVLCKALISC